MPGNEQVAPDVAAFDQDVRLDVLDGGVVAFFVVQHPKLDKADKLAGHVGADVGKGGGLGNVHLTACAGGNRALGLHRVDAADDDLMDKFLVVFVAALYRCGVHAGHDVVNVRVIAQAALQFLLADVGHLADHFLPVQTVDVLSPYAHLAWQHDVGIKPRQHLTMLVRQQAPACVGRAAASPAKQRLQPRVVHDFRHCLDGGLDAQLHEGRSVGQRPEHGVSKCHVHVRCLKLLRQKTAEVDFPALPFLCGLVAKLDHKTGFERAEQERMQPVGVRAALVEDRRVGEVVRACEQVSAPCGVLVDAVLLGRKAFLVRSDRPIDQGVF